MTLTDSTTDGTTADPHAPEDELLVQANAERLVGELAHAGFISMVALGDRLGLYAALHRLGSATAAQLGAQSGCHPRLVLEWLCSNAAAGYAVHDPADDSFRLAPGAAAVLADETSPAFLAPAAVVIRSYYSDQDRLEAAFRGTAQLGWGDHRESLYGGVERFFSTAYTGSLVPAWIPAVPGLDEKLRAGALVLDVGCGHGISTAIMAAEYPASRFRGIDSHVPSIERAAEVARARGVEANTTYAVASATDDTGGPYDVVCFFDALHDMGDPEAAIRQARAQIADDGVVLLVEIAAGADLTASLQSPFGAWMFAASTALCTPCALAQDGPLALGNQAGPARMEQLFRANGFSRFRVAMETPFNLVMEARP